MHVEAASGATLRINGALMRALKLSRLGIVDRVSVQVAIPQDASLDPLPEHRLSFRLRPGDLLLINGGKLVARNGAAFLLHSSARMAAGKQVLPREHATTPTLRICHAIQCAYTGCDGDPAENLAVARTIFADEHPLGAAPIIDALDSGGGVVPAHRLVLQVIRSLRDSPPCEVPPAAAGAGAGAVLAAPAAAEG